MSDQQPPANPQDTAAVAGPIEAPGAAQEQPQEVNWEKRYQDLQPEYTRTTQQLKELEQQKQWYELLVTSDDPDTRRQAAEVLGYALPDDEESEEPEPAEYEDPYETLAQRQERLEQRLNEREQEAQQQAQFQLLDRITTERLNSLEGLSDKAKDWILGYAINALEPVHEPGIPVPLPDLNTAYQEWQALVSEEQKSWAKTKRAPFVASGGLPANEVPDPGTGHQARMNRAMLSLRNSMGDNE